MSRKSIFVGSLSSTAAIAGVVMQRFVRAPSIWLIVFGFPLTLLTFEPSAGLTESASRARFLSFALSRAEWLLPLFALLSTLAFFQKKSQRTAIDEAGRLAGPAAVFWGQAVGVGVVTVALSLLMGTWSIAGFSRHFDGGAESFGMRGHFATSTAADQFPAFLRKPGDSTQMDFEYDSSRHSQAELTAVFRPRVSITGDGWPARGSLPVKLRFFDEESGWERVKTVFLHEGRPATLRVTLPRTNRPQQVSVEIQSIHPAAFLRIQSDSLQLAGREKSLFGSILTGSLIAGLFMAAIAAWILFFLNRWSIAVAALAGLGFYAVAVFAGPAIGAGIVSDGVWASAVTGIFSSFLPDIGSFELSEWLPRGRALPGSLVLKGLGEFLLTVFVLGAIEGWLPRLSRRLPMAASPERRPVSDSHEFPTAAAQRQSERRPWIAALTHRQKYALLGVVTAGLIAFGAYLVWVEDEAIAESPTAGTWAPAVPIQLELLWAEANELQTESRYWELVDVFEKIARLDPKSDRIWFHQAYTMSHDIGQSERSANRRWRWYRRALVHAKEGMRRHPENWRLAYLHFSIWRDLVADDSSVDRICRRQLKHDGLYEAMAAAGEIKEQFPQRQEAWDLYLNVGESVCGRLLLRGSDSRALEALKICEATAREMHRRFPAMRRELPLDLYQEWARALQGLVDRAGLLDGDLLNSGLLPTRARSLLQALEGLSANRKTLPHRTPLDETLIQGLHFRSVRQIQDLTVGEMNPIALRLAAQVRKIFAVALPVAGAGKPYHDRTYIEQLVTFIQTDAEFLSARSAKSARVTELKKSWTKQLALLDRRVSAATEGQSDGFARRMRQARH